MCIAVPGKIISIEENPLGAVGKVSFGGIVREVCLAFVPDVGVGDHVMVHVGFALSRIDAAEAERTLALLRELGAMAEKAPEQGETVHGI